MAGAGVAEDLAAGVLAAGALAAGAVFVGAGAFVAGVFVGVFAAGAFALVGLPVVAAAGDFCDAVDREGAAVAVFVVDFVAGATFLGAAADGFATVNPCA